MTTALSLSAAQFRLARYYVDIMRRANAAIQRGHGNRAYWYNRIEQDWGQIRHWQTWSAEASEADLEHSQVCLDFSIQGLEVLRVRQSPPERIAWLRQALEVAQRIGDGAAERTILHELGHTYFLIGAGDEAEQTAQHLLEIAEAAKDDFNIGRAWYVLGQVGIFRGTLDVAEDAFRKSIVLLERTEAEAELGRAFQGIGRTAMYRGDNPSAYDYFLRYLNVVEGSGREAELGPAYLTMSHVLLEMKDYPQAKTYAERALQICLSTGFQRMLPSTWLTLGVTAAEMDDLEAASHYYDEGIVMARASQAKSSMIELLWYRGDARMRRRDFGSAYTDLREALSLARENHILYFLCEITTALSRWHLHQNQVEAAREPLLEALGFALELGSNNFLVLPLVSAIMLWRLMGQAEQATRWAGLLSNYPQYVHPRLFTPLCAQLALDLGGDDYQQAFERGKSLNLKETVNDVIGLLNLPENGGGAVGNGG